MVRWELVSCFKTLRWALRGHHSELNTVVADAKREEILLKSGIEDKFESSVEKKICTTMPAECVYIQNPLNEN